MEEDHAGRKAVLHITPTHQMTGVVRDGHFHVDDVIHDGVAASSFGDAPEYNPIALTKIAEKGDRVEYLE